MAFHNTTKNNG